ncbi:YhhN-like protein [Fennellomyces sp. T-0311]|nr:YhhN-like protein [Fennellomyces sp. T-0311]
MPLSFPPFPAAPFLLGTLPCLVFSEHSSRSLAGTSLFKMLSSVAFLSGPLILTAKEPAPYRVLITTGLACSLVGDYCLLPSSKTFYPSKSPNAEPQQKTISKSFQMGVVAFAAAHVAYIVAFLRDSQHTSWPTFATTFIATMSLAKWMGVTYPPPHSSTWSNMLDLSITDDMKPLVSIYAVIISSMLAAATSTAPLDFATPWPHQRLLGAAMFVASDLFVAKDSFGRSSDPRKRGWFRILVGYGLYFWGQMVIAGTVQA